MALPIAVSGTVMFEPGTHPGYPCNGSGVVTGRKTITLGARSSAPATQRVRVVGRGSICAPARVRSQATWSPRTGSGRG